MFFIGSARIHFPPARGRPEAACSFVGGAEGSIRRGRLLHVGELGRRGRERVRQAGADGLERAYHRDRDEGGETAVAPLSSRRKRMNMGLSFFRRFETTSSRMRSKFGRMREAIADNFALCANAPLAMELAWRRMRRRCNELFVRDDGRRLATTFTTRQEQILLFAVRVA